MDMRYERTEKLLKEACERLGETKDIYKLTVSELTEEAGINRLSFYLHYENIDSFIAALEDAYLKKFIEEMSPFDDFIFHPEDIIHRMMTFYKDKGTNMYSKGSGYGRFMQKSINAIIEKIIEESGNNNEYFRRKIIFVINGIKGIFEHNSICDEGTVDDLAKFIKRVIEE